MSRRPSGREQQHKFNPGFDRFSGLYLLALFIIVFGIWVPDKFLTTATLHSIASEQAIVAMLGLAVLIPLSAGVFDLSIGAMINMSAIVVSLLQVKHGWPMVPSIIAAIIVTTFIGFVNGFLVVKLQISAFIATLGSATIIGAFQVIITNQSQPLPPTSTAWNNLTQQKIFGFQIVFLYLIVLALIAWWVMDHTPPGRYIYATGGNPEAARLSGVKVGMWVWLSFVGVRLRVRHRRRAVRLAERPVADVRRLVAAARLRGRVPRLDAAETGAVQRLGHDHRGLRARRRREGPLARHERAVAQRDVQRRRACWPPSPSPVGSSAARPLGAGPGSTPARRPRRPRARRRSRVSRRSRAPVPRRRGLTLAARKCARIAPSTARSAHTPSAAPRQPPAGISGVSRRRPPAASRCSAPSRRGTTRSARR